jgi:hypothetical protein
MKTNNAGRAAWLELLGNYEGPRTCQFKVVTAQQTSTTPPGVTIWITTNLKITVSVLTTY